MLLPDTGAAPAARASATSSQSASRSSLVGLVFVSATSVPRPQEPRSARAPDVGTGGVPRGSATVGSAGRGGIDSGQE